MSELVGEAYVRVHADTRYMKAELKRSLTELGTAEGNNFGDSFADHLRARLKARLSGAIQEGLLSGNFDGLAKQLGSSDKALEKTKAFLEDLHREGQLSEVEFGQMRDAVENWKKSLDLRAFQAQWVAYEKTQKEAFIDEKKRMDAQTRNIAANLRQTQAAVDDAHLAALKINKIFDKSGEHSYFKSLQREARNTDTRISQLLKTIDKFNIGDPIGKMFGAGARNNFFNAIGLFVGGVTNAGVAVLKFPLSALDGIQRAIGSLADDFNAFKQSGSSAFIAAIQTLGGAASAGAAGIAALGIAVVVVSTFLGIAVSAVSLLAGGILALTGAVAVGLTGALLALGPIAVAAFAGITVLVSAFRKMTDEQKAALKPLKDAFATISNKVTDTLFSKVNEQVKLLVPLLDNFAGPLMTGVAAAIRDAFSYFLGIMREPGMKEFLDAFSTSIPKIVGSLGRTFANLAASIFAFFKPILPFSENLATTVEGLSKTFLDWTKSAKGQNSIKEFMEKAWKAAGDLWEIVKNVVLTVSSLFTQGNYAGGGDLLSRLKDLTKEWLIWVNTPGNQEVLRQWFKDGSKFVQDVVSAIGDLIAEFQKLDTPENRALASDLVSGFREFVKVLQVISTLYPQALNKGIELLKGIPSLIGSAATGIDKFSTALRDGLLSTGPNTVGWGTTFGQTVSDALTGATTSISTWATNLPSTLAYDLGAGAGVVVAFFTEEYNRLAVWFETTFIPFIQSWPQRVRDNLVTGVTFLVDWFNAAYTGAQTWFETVLIPFILSWPSRVRDNLLTGATFLVDWFNAAWTGLQAWFTTVVFPFFDTLSGQIRDRLLMGVTFLVEWFTSAWNAVTAWFAVTVFPFIASLPGMFRDRLMAEITWIRDSFNDAWTLTLGWFNTIVFPFISGLGRQFRDNLLKEVTFLRDWFSQGWSQVLSFWNETIVPFLREAPRRVGDFFTGIASGVAAGIAAAFRSNINTVIDRINDAVRGFNDFSPFKIAGIDRLASGGVLYGARVIMAGEAGPEAIVPLRRNLSQVDPSVRALSAFAQGLPQFRGGGVVGGGHSVTVAAGAISVLVPNTDPYLAASAVLDRLAASSR